MTHDQAQEMLADYLGGELDESQKQQFEAYLTGDPALAAEVDSLRRTLAAMRAIDEPVTAPVPWDGTPPARTDDPRASGADDRTVWKHGRMAVLLRYAAIIVFAFGAGFLANAGARGPGVTTPSSVVEPAPKNQDRARQWETRIAVAYAKQPGRSGLARSLVALARAAREP